MKVARYLSVSTDKQESENQAVQPREFAMKQGRQVVREYTDYESGAIAERTQFKQMFEDASLRKFDLVLFWARDRLSREKVYQTLQHLNRLESYGVGSALSPSHISTPVQFLKDAVIAIMATPAKQERIKRSERTSAELARVQAAGGRLKRPQLNGQGVRGDSPSQCRAISTRHSTSAWHIRGNRPPSLCGCVRFVMVFTKRLREGVRQGKITCSVRIWTRPHVRVGAGYRMEEGEIEIDSIEFIGFPDITPELARESGSLGVLDLLKVAKHGNGQHVYLARFHYVRPRPKHKRKSSN